MKHVVPTDSINKILHYMATKPYSEVFQLIHELQNLSIPYQEPKVPVASEAVSE